MGFVMPGKSFSVIDIDQCELQGPRANEIMNYVSQLISRFAEQLDIHNPDTKTGCLQSVGIRKARAPTDGSDTYHIEFISTHQRFNRLRCVAEPLVNRFPDIASIVSTERRFVEGTKKLISSYIMLHGPPYLLTQAAGMTWRVSPHAFFQTNDGMVDKLVALVLAAADVADGDVVFDAYCGVGLYALSIARQGRARAVYGFDVSPDAIEDAEYNAIDNDVDNVEFRCIDMNRLRVLNDGALSAVQPDVVVANPSKSGLSQAIINYVLLHRPRRLVYVSCHPATQARDLQQLVVGERSVFEVVQATPLDMFPQTSNIETVMVLQRDEEKCAALDAMAAQAKMVKAQRAELKRQRYEEMLKEQENNGDTELVGLSPRERIMRVMAEKGEDVDIAPSNLKQLDNRLGVERRLIKEHWVKGIVEPGETDLIDLLGCAEETSNPDFR